MKMHHARQVQGFTLVEVALALGIAAFCLVAIFGLLPIGFNTNQASIEQTAAANAAVAVRLDLQGMPKGTDPTTIQSPLYKIPAPPGPIPVPPSASASPGATVAYSFFLREDFTATGSPGADAKAADKPRYRVTVTYNIPAANQVFSAVPTRIFVSWPAMADPVAGTAPAHYSGSLEVNTSLLRE